MARWRAEALERLSELRETINSAPNIMAFWIEPCFEFRQAYERKPPDESLIARIYLFADWCVSAPRGPDAGHDPLTAVMVASYEDIPTIPAASQDMPRWFTYAAIKESRSVFSYFIGDEGYRRLLEHVRRNEQRCQPRAIP
jgi:hypothetical protein